MQRLRNWLRHGLEQDRRLVEELAARDDWAAAAVALLVGLLLW